MTSPPASGLKGRKASAFGEDAGGGVKILGVDPGSRLTGYGLIQVEGSNVRSLEYGVITTPSGADLPKRLTVIHRGLADVIDRNRPDNVVVEEIFYRKNFKSSIMIGEVRGVAVLAAASKGIPVQGYPPARVKQAIVGNGRAVKSQVQVMVCRLLGLKEMPAEDASDALAIALCHSHSMVHMRHLGSRLNRSGASFRTKARHV